VTIPGSGDIKSFTRLTGSLTGHYFGAGDMTVDPTSFGSVFGRSPRWADAKPLAWPGWYNDLLWFHLPVANYISLQFTVTADALSAPTQGNQAMYGRYMIGEDTSAGGIKPPLSMSISTRCGDFSPPGSAGSTVVGQCLVNKAGADGGLAWRKTGPATAKTCVLVPGTYYLNLINADVSEVTANGGTAATTKNAMDNYPGLKNHHATACGSDGCDVEVANGPGSWINRPSADITGDSGGSTGGSGTPAPPPNNALVCTGGKLQAGHKDFFSPMPPACSAQGLSAGQDCVSAQSCPL
jgi:hypothetical protein